MEPKVSVIVPVYKTEKYLRKCLDSLVMQTLDEMEIIVVNDGSPDSSQDIIDEYVQRFPNKIKAILKENGGLGDARNVGLKQARGKYVGFVDSDDWVDPKMFETLYKATYRGHDLIICDLISISENEENQHVASGFRGETFNKPQAVMYSTDPAFACNKLFKKKLFKKAKFLKDWYEDVSTTPILMSYAESIYYVQSPFYYYRQRPDSMTSSQDKRTLGIIKGWERLLKEAKAKYINEVIFAVARGISIFIDFKPAFAKEFIEFAEKNKKTIEKNKYYREAVRKNEIKDLYNAIIIPPIIHYCWFGGKEKSELAKKCIKTWKEKLPDYKFMEWNETNCNMEINTYVKQAYESGKWAFVSDYFRLKYLYEYGGIYMDTDVEITKNIDSFRINNTFLSFESADFIQTGIIGSVKRAPLIKKLMEFYQNESFITETGEYNAKPNVPRTTSLLVNEYGLQLNGKRQALKDGIVIYPVNELTLDVGDGQNYAVHHFDSSWWDDKTGPTWKEVLFKKYFEEQEQFNK